MKGIVILAVALLVGSLFIGAFNVSAASSDQGKEVSANSASKINPETFSGRFGVAKEGNNKPNQKKISPTTATAAKSLEPKSVASLTPSISLEEVESSIKAVTTETNPGNLKAVGFPTSQSGVGNVIDSNGNSKNIELSIITQAYSEPNGDNEVQVSEGKLVFADKTYSTKLTKISADNTKTYSIKSDSVEVGTLSVKDTNGVVDGKLNLEGNEYDVNVKVEENKVNPSSLSSQAQVQTPQAETIVTKIISWFKGLFG